MPSSVVTLKVNGRAQEFLTRPGTTLLDALRESLSLTAAKKGCAQGTCGTCTVLLDGKPVFACLVPIETVGERKVETLEGLADGAALHALQESFIENFATQCGFCSSGMIMAAKGLLTANPSPSRTEVVRAISGNVCRCTGYEAIIDAVLAAAAKMKKAAPPRKKAAE
ncbi:(2Fe-2S)-binding protein [Dongia sp.]|uniref:(2Fe-2S)-binding protein n=1 Tax=Dongia sp. TaxID=1977262 RepID=UPI003750B35B